MPIGSHYITFNIDTYITWSSHYYLNTSTLPYIVPDTYNIPPNTYYFGTSFYAHTSTPIPPTLLITPIPVQTPPSSPASLTVVNLFCSQIRRIFDMFQAGSRITRQRYQGNLQSSSIRKGQHHNYCSSLYSTKLLYYTTLLYYYTTLLLNYITLLLYYTTLHYYTLLHYSTKLLYYTTLLYYYTTLLLYYTTLLL